MNSQTPSPAPWYLSLPDALAPEGPYSLADIRSKLNEKDSAGMHVWKEGMPAWTLIGDVPEINAKTS